MRLLRLLIVPLAWVASAAQLSPPSFPKVVGGFEAPPVFPYMASLQRRYNGRYRHICGASLVHVSWLVTAGHCVDRGFRYRVVLSRYNLKRKSKYEMVRSVRSVHLHPRFTGTSRNDIAMLRINSIWLNRQISPNVHETFHAGARMVAIGWGYKKEYSGILSNKLMQVNLPLVSREDCAKAYPGIDMTTKVCAGYADGGKDTCSGDSGGPLLSNATVPVLVGITSYGKGCARPGYFGVYTRVSAYTDWIRSVIDEMS